MNLFMLEAGVTLNTTEFGKGISDARADVQGLGDEINGISDIAPDMTQFSTSVSTAMANAKDEAGSVDDKLDELTSKSAATQAVFEGFAQATSQVVEHVIEGIIDFGKEAIEIAAASGSEVAAAYIESTDDFDFVMRNLKESVGELLLPAVTGAKDAFSSLFSTGFEDSQRAREAFAGISAISFENLEHAKESISGIFNLFEKVNPAESGDIAGMTEGLQSQADYWLDYAQTMAALQETGIDPELIAQLADGTAKGLESLKALETADASQLEAFLEAYQAVQEAQAAAAEGISEAQLEADEEFQALLNSYVEFIAGTDQSTQAKANAILTASSISRGLESQYPTISSWVDKINAKLSQIGNVSVSAPSVSLPDPGFATGLDYVPYDDFAARLHEGEAVLTKLEAERWRRGENGNGARASSEGPTSVTVNVYGSADGDEIGYYVKEAMEDLRWKA